MAFTYDTTTTIGQLRSLLGDVTEEGHAFTDEQLQGWLNMGDGRVLKGAYYVYLALAGNQSLLRKYTAATGESYDGPAASKELREIAKMYRDEDVLAVEDADEEGYVAIVHTPRFTWETGRFEGM